MRFIRLLSVCLVASSISGCADFYYDVIGRGAWPHEDDSLYSRLGGESGVNTLVNGWLDTAAADPRIGTRFAGVDMAQFKAVLTQWLCVQAAGPCVYTGPGMIDAHTGLAISDTDFDAFIDDLKTNLNANRVPTDEQKELLALLAAKRGAVIAVEG